MGLFLRKNYLLSACVSDYISVSYNYNIMKTKYYVGILRTRNSDFEVGKTQKLKLE